MTGWWLPEIDMLRGGCVRRARGNRAQQLGESDWENRLTDSIDELRAAHTWLVGRDADASLRLVSALRPYALWRGQSEVFRWADVAVASAAATDSPLLPHALFAAETGAWQRGDVEVQQRPPLPPSKPRCGESPGRPAVHSRHALMWRCS